MKLKQVSRATFGPHQWIVQPSQRHCQHQEYIRDLSPCILTHLHLPKCGNSAHFCFLGKIESVGYNAKLGIKTGWCVTFRISGKTHFKAVLISLWLFKWEISVRTTAAHIAADHPNQWICYFLTSLFELKPHLHGPQIEKTACSHWSKYNIKIYICGYFHSPGITVESYVRWWTNVLALVFHSPTKDTEWTESRKLPLNVVDWALLPSRTKILV